MKKIRITGIEEHVFSGGPIYAVRLNVSIYGKSKNLYFPAEDELEAYMEAKHWLTKNKYELETDEEG